MLCKFKSKIRKKLKKFLYFEPFWPRFVSKVKKLAKGAEKIVKLNFSLGINKRSILC